MSSLLWWGRSDRDYSRNRIVLTLLSELGFQTDFFHPHLSYTASIEAFLRHMNKPEAIWVPCFRQRDIRSASRMAKKWKIPLIIDPLISAFEKEVYERRKYAENSDQAKRKRQWEAGLFSLADIVVADTSAHADFFSKTLGVAPERLSVLYVGAEDLLFSRLNTVKPGSGPLEILFYGSFLQLQGIDTIIKAAAISQNLNATWVLLGNGELRPAMEKAAEGISNIRFESWMPYSDLPGRIAKADILLGIFGDTKKADLVIPNKMFQAMSAGKPVITRYSKAYPQEMLASDIIGWIPCGDHVSLSDKVRQWIKDPEELSVRGAETKKLFDRFFSREVLIEMLDGIVKKAIGGNF